MNEKSTDTYRQRITKIHPQSLGDSEQLLAAIRGTDVSNKIASTVWSMDPSLQIDSYPVDEGGDRRVFRRQAEQSHWTSGERQTMAIRSGTQRDLQRAGNTCRLHSDSHRNLSRSQQCRKLSVVDRSGQALLEFAILIPIFIILIGATISFGLFFYQGNSLQQAVDVAAQEIARMPYGPTQELGLGRLDKCNLNDLVCDDADFKAQIYDERHLVIPDSAWDAGSAFNNDFQAYVATLPLLNRLLVPVMIRDNAREMTRYPGALVTNDDGDLTVLIPLVAYNYNGVVDGFQCAGETIVEWVAPVEEIRVDHDADGGTPDEGPYRLVTAAESANDIPSFTRGMVALRINFPAQSTTLINRTSLPAGSNPDGVVGQVIVVANDQILTDGDTGCYSLVVNDPPVAGNPADPFGGRYGLGSLGVIKGRVRPYRKVMTFQAIYRREVFADE